MMAFDPDGEAILRQFSPRPTLSATSGPSLGWVTLEGGSAGHHLERLADLARDEVDDLRGRLD
jgi:hypothetical protein